MFDSFKIFKWIVSFMYGYGGAKNKYLFFKKMLSYLNMFGDGKRLTYIHAYG